jgi:hypothetical protein
MSILKKDETNPKEETEDQFEQHWQSHMFRDLQ